MNEVQATNIALPCSAETTAQTHERFCCQTRAASSLTDPFPISLFFFFLPCSLLLSDSLLFPIILITFFLSGLCQSPKKLSFIYGFFCHAHVVPVQPFSFLQLAVHVRPCVAFSFLPSQQSVLP